MQELIRFATLNGIKRQDLYRLDPEAWNHNFTAFITSIPRDNTSDYAEVLNQIENSFDAAILDYLFNIPKLAFIIRYDLFRNIPLEHPLKKHPRIIQLDNTIMSTSPWNSLVRNKFRDLIIKVAKINPETIVSLGPDISAKSIINLAKSKNKRIREAEIFILNDDPRYIIEYAAQVIEGRWNRGEKAILKKRKNRDFIVEYYEAVRKFVSGMHFRWREAEEILIKNKRLWPIAIEYSDKAMLGDWPAFKKAILATDSAYAAMIAVDYAIMEYEQDPGGRPQRWEKAEPLIKKYPEAAKEYKKFLRRRD